MILDRSIKGYELIKITYDITKHDGAAIPLKEPFHLFKITLDNDEICEVQLSLFLSKLVEYDDSLLDYALKHEDLIYSPMSFYEELIDLGYDFLLPLGWYLKYKHEGTLTINPDWYRSVLKCYNNKGNLRDFSIVELIKAGVTPKDLEDYD